MEKTILAPRTQSLFVSTDRLSVHAEPPISELERTLRIAFDHFRSALINKDHTGLRSAMAEYSYMKAKNEAQRVKLLFPDDLFCGIVGKMTAGVDLRKSKTLRVEVKGNTGMLLSYFSTKAGFDPFQLGTGMPVVIILRFIRELGVWKYDSLTMNPRDPDQEAELNNGNFAQLNDDRFHPTGVVLPTPVEQGSPCYDYDALINVNSFGYHAEVIINDMSIVKTTANTAARVGLKKGENKINIKSAVLEHPDIIRVSIQARKDKNSAPVEVYKIQLDHPESYMTEEFVVRLE